MAVAKKNYKTLYAKHGRIWLKDENQPDTTVSLPFAATYLYYEEALRNKLVPTKSDRKSLYVPYEDFEELKRQFKKLKQEIEQIQEFRSSKELEIAVKDALTQLEKIVEIGEVNNCSENRNLTLLVSAKNYSASLFRKIANIEIDLSKKYVDVKVEIRPVLNDEKSAKKLRAVKRNELANRTF